MRANGSARGRRRWTRRIEEGGGGREECSNRKHVQLLPRASPPPPPFPAGSTCCLWPSSVYIPREHRALDDLLHDQGACQATASAQPGADTYLGEAAPPEKAAHMLVGTTAEKPRRACCAQSSGSDACVARAHTGLQWRAVREASCAHGHVSGGEWQGPVAGQLRERCQSSRRRATSRPAPRPGGEFVVLARRQLEAAVGHSCSADDGGKHTEKGRREAPRAKTPRAATSRHRHILARAACLLRVWTSSSTTARPLPPSHRVAHRRPLRAQRPRRDADRGGSRSRCGSSRYATGGLLLP